MEVANKLLLKIVLLASLTIACSQAEEVKFGPCTNHVNMNCKVDAVRVTPCAEAEENKPCVIKRGKTATIEFDYEPSGNYSDLETRAYWASVTGDLPFIGMDTNGCAHTVCPTTPPKETFSYNLSLSKKLPVVSSSPGERRRC
ncbi:hypothetical protein RUM43_001618 [Polyplax serrata]|uniref:MD-2-related lipid-recognition domain-containing protein n=1 Tax=Polyplax serrata TaxID=468196 RepID=A0AAN8XU88_POLSC